MEAVKRFKENLRGQDWAVGDVHAHVSRLRAALKEIGFDPAVDRLFCTGDLVDRGDEPFQVLNLMKEPWFYSVMGNHDDFAVRLCEDRPIDIKRYIEGGGGWNMQNTRENQQRFADAFRDLPFAIEVENDRYGMVGITHANCVKPTWAEFTQALRDQTEGTQVQKTARHDAMWDRDRFKTGTHEIIPDIRAVIVGHCTTPVPKVLGNVHFIDTGGWTSRRAFTFIKLDSLVTITVRTAEGT
jgi:serine/threonine protein phosphatase 1